MHITYDSETVAQGQQVITVCAFIHHTFDGVDKVFLPKRAETKKFLPGVYELPGGHVDFGEDPIVGLKREIYEEFGMNIEVGDPFYVFTYTNQIKGSHSIEVVYFARFTDDISAVQLDPKLHSEYGWYAAPELHDAYVREKGEDDIEFHAAKKGFALLAGESPVF
jgi:8-oxo-dGTP pyrophosphatase MutT (NUDIX family)